MSVNCLNHAYQRRIVDRMERLECVEPWDERPSGVLLEDVQAALFACACHHARNCGRLAQSLSDQASILHATGLARGRFLTNSGAVLFSDANEPLVSCRLFSGARHDGLIDSASHFSPYVCALETLLEAAAMDGAGPFRRFWTVVFPLLSPTTFFLLVMNIVYAFFDTFAIVDATTMGGPGQDTNILVYKVFVDGFRNMDFGGSAAQSVILMVMVIILTVIQFRFIERRVNY